MTDEPLVTTESRFQAWPVAWSAVWVGALAAVAVGVLIGLIGYAIGAHQIAKPAADWRNVRLVSAIFSIGGAFFAFVVGGWVVTRIAGFRRAEFAMLHGAIVWLMTLPFMMLLGALGSGGYLGGWYGGLAGAIPTDMAVAAAFRNTAVTTVVALLLGLVGSALGAWMASGEPMTFAYYRRRQAEATYERPRRAA